MRSGIVWVAGTVWAAGSVWVEDATKLLNTRPMFALCPVLGLVVGQE